MLFIYKFMQFTAFAFFSPVFWEIDGIFDKKAV